VRDCQENTSSQLAGVVYFRGCWDGSWFFSGRYLPPPPPSLWMIGTLMIRRTCHPSAPGGTYHSIPENQATIRRVAGAGQGYAPGCPVPGVPPMGTQAGPLPVGLAGGIAFGKARRMLALLFL
jgi:hypothetical protein